MCRGGEGGVKGCDRLAAAWAALDTTRASAMLHYSGNVSRICPVDHPVRNLFRFHKIEKSNAPIVP